MKHTELLILAVTLTLFSLPSRLVGQDAAAADTYKGDAFCPSRQGVFPHRIHAVDPEYDDKDRKKKVQGAVYLSLIITKEGETAEIKVEKSLTPGLDRQAVKAVSQWRFEPMINDGKACPVKLKAEVEFRLY